MKKKECRRGAGFAAAGLMLMMAVFMVAETLADSLHGWMLAAALIAAAGLLMHMGQAAAERRERG